MIRIAALLALLVLVASTLEPARISVTGDDVQPVLAPARVGGYVVTVSPGGGGGRGAMLVQTPCSTSAAGVTTACTITIPLQRATP